MDAFASAFGFFLVGFDGISNYNSPQCIGYRFFGVSDPVLWFFKVNLLSARIAINFCNSSPLLVMLLLFLVVVWLVTSINFDCQLCSLVPLLLV